MRRNQFPLAVEVVDTDHLWLPEVRAMEAVEAVDSTVSHGGSTNLKAVAEAVINRGEYSYG